MSRACGGNGGVIINVSSMAGLMPAPQQPVYTATKCGVIGFTRAMAETSKRENYGVRINTMCPAFVNTPILKTIDEEENMGKYFKDRDAIRKMMSNFGILEPAAVADGLMKIIEDETLNGAVMKITKTKGIHFEDYATGYLQEVQEVVMRKDPEEANEEVTESRKC
uniref:15-hydroxyprostaglandin dehydrogenase [NAD(+)] n=1 Tax=Latimeria chalumnae TaxID=7897 RepID=M3XGZ5_LATCH